MEKVAFVDPYAEQMVKMAYANKNNKTTLEDALTKSQIATLDLKTVTSQAATWATSNNRTSPCGNILNFPESRLLSISDNSIGGQGGQEYATSYYTNLRSYILPLENTSSALLINQGSFLGASTFTNCSYVDYGDRAKWHRYNHLNDRRNQIMVFWQKPSYYYNNGSGDHANPPNNTNLILVPKSIAYSVYTSLGQNLLENDGYKYFPVSLKDCILVFTDDERTQGAQYRLW